MINKQSIKLKKTDKIKTQKKNYKKLMKEIKPFIKKKKKISVSTTGRWEFLS